MSYLWPDGKQHSIPYATHQSNVKKNAASPSKHDLAWRLKHVVGLLAKYQADPGLRSKLPDQYLTPGQLAGRKHNQYLADISNPAGTLAGPSLVNAAHQITNSEFDPLLKDIDKQGTQSRANADALRAAASGYYGNVNSLLGSILGSQDTANAAAVKGATDRGAATAAAISGAADAAKARMAEDAAIRGGGLQGDSASILATQTAAQQAAAAQDAQRAQTAAAGAGDASAAFLRGLQGSAAQQGGQLQGAITAQQTGQMNALGAQRAKLNAQRLGQFTNTLLRLRQQEADNLFTRAGLNLDQAKLNAASQPSMSDQKTAAELAFFKKHGYWPQTGAPKGPSASDKKTAADLAFFKKHGYYPPTGPPKKGGKGGTGSSGGATNKETGDAQNAISAATAAAKASGIPIPKDRSQAGALTRWLMTDQPEQAETQTVRNKNGSVSRKVVTKPAHKAVDALYASVVADILIDGHVSRYNANRLHARGLKLKDLGLPSYADYQKSHPKTASNYGGGAGAGSGIS